nr:PE family protein [Mycobacterium tuberculosis]
MSFLVVVPEFLTSAAADVENIGSRPIPARRALRR